MADFVFTSPGVKFREKDISFITRNLGITSLGLVGETLKGPAFEPVFIEDKTQFLDRFGSQSIKRFSNGNLQYQLPYVANAYLSESNQLYVTRILGLSGYDAGTAWAITLNAGVDPDTTGVEEILSDVTVSFANNIYLGVSLNTDGDTGTYSSGYTKTGATSFVEYVHAFTATTVNLDGTGIVLDRVTRMSGTSYTAYEGMVLAIIRSRGYVRDNVNSTPTTVFDTTSLTITGNSTNIDAGDLFGQFVLRASSTASTETYTVSLNPNAANFISNVVGLEPKDKNTKIWVESTYPDLIKKLDVDGIGYGINTTLLNCNTSVFTNYKTQFKTPETPWVVSQLKGSTVDRLFKFVSISDGNSANQEIKISITNINPITYEFDVVVRDFNDTDDNVSVLETFSRCTLINGQTSYLAQRIGTTDGEYTLNSKYIMVEMSSELSSDVFPAGFEGYSLPQYPSHK